MQEQQNTPESRAGISVINTAWKEKLQGRWVVKRLAEAAAIISRPKQLNINRVPYMMGCAGVHPLSNQWQSGPEIRRTTGIVDELQFVGYHVFKNHDSNSLFQQHADKQSFHSSATSHTTTPLTLEGILVECPPFLYSLTVA